MMIYNCSGCIDFEKELENNWKKKSRQETIQFKRSMQTEVKMKKVPNN